MHYYFAVGTIVLCLGVSIKGGKHETGLGEIDGMIMIAVFDTINHVLNVFFFFSTVMQGSENTHEASELDKLLDSLFGTFKDFKNALDSRFGSIESFTSSLQTSLSSQQNSLNSQQRTQQSEILSLKSEVANLGNFVGFRELA